MAEVIISSQKSLAVVLSKLEGFDHPRAALEQYPTDSEVAAILIWSAVQQGDIKKRVVTDLGAGTGILSIGAALMEAKKVRAIECDSSAIEVLKRNIVRCEKLTGLKLKKKVEIREQSIEELSAQHADTVIMNPPFGMQTKGADRVFLQKAMETADVIYSIHNSKSTRFIENMARERAWKITHKFFCDFALKQTFLFHTKRIHRIPVLIVRMTSNLKVNSNNATQTL